MRVHIHSSLSKDMATRRNDEERQRNGSLYNFYLILFFPNRSRLGHVSQLNKRIRHKKVFFPLSIITKSIITTCFSKGIFPHDNGSP